MATKRRTASARPRWEHLDDSWFGRYPGLIGFLGDVKFDDGTPRVPGAMLIQVEDGTLKVKLSDREECLSVWLSGTDLDDLLALAEQAAQGEAGDWRPDKWLQDAARKRRRGGT